MLDTGELDLITSPAHTALSLYLQCVAHEAVDQDDDVDADHDGRDLTDHPGPCRGYY